MALGTLVKTLQNIMRKDAGINGDAQRIEQMTWLFFLKIYDAKEEEWEFHDDSYESIIPERLRWHSWAVDHKDGKALTGEALLDFVNNDLFKTLPNLELSPNAPLRQVVVKAAFTDANNYMKDGILLRQVVNEIDNAVDFTEYKERHAFGEIYETISRISSRLETRASSTLRAPSRTSWRKRSPRSSASALPTSPAAPVASSQAHSRFSQSR